MERDGQLELYDRVAARLRDAHRKVRSLQVPQDVRQALTRKLLIITAAAKHDLPGAARRLDRLMEDVDAGRLPASRAGGDRDGSP
ncbi:SCO5555 family protein [Streptomyces litchfieldiae]|uniref:Uncharacterized protein n=1 Tax=Streptomyces litchfieldiae TaxID=3075543 RepID=A0ABU2MHW4_9ACTN|nr:hypothetical protein [Streptomyces sp. DSM 44938]MDT0341182.1 hypothetical protein [Streptomyces sp. DSM 44938]